MGDVLLQQTRGDLTKVDAPMEWTYDTVYKRVATMIDGTGMTSYAYHAVNGTTAPLGDGQLASVDGPLANDTIAYTYDDLGRVLTRTVNGGSTVTAVYDTLGRVDTLTNPLGTFDYAYVNNTARLDYVDYPNTQRVDFEYYPNTPAVGGTGNGDRRLQTIRNLGVGSGGTGSVLSRFDYQYNIIGQITEWQQEHSAMAQPQKYLLGYDAADQLTFGTLKNATTGAVLKEYGFGYDSAGNRTLDQTDQSPRSASYNALNQLTSRGDASEMMIRGSVNEPASLTITNGSTTVAANVQPDGQFTAKVSVTAGTNNTLEFRAKDASGNETTPAKTAVVNVPGTVKGSVAQRQEKAAQLRKAMSALAKVGRTLDPELYPDVAAKVRTSGLNSYQSYLDRAGVIIETVNPIKQVFIDLGAKETVIEDLQALKAALEAAGARKDSGLDEQIGGTAGLEAEIRIGRRHVRKLDAILSQVFEDDPARLAAWQAAKRVQQDPEPSPEAPAAPEPPPGGEGSPA